MQEIKDATNSGVTIVFNFKDVIIMFMEIDKENYGQTVLHLFFFVFIEQQYLLSCQRQARYSTKKMLQGQQLITLPQELLTKLIFLKHPGVGTSYILKCQRINSL